MLRVLGVHPVEAAEPVHLVEIQLSIDVASFDWGTLTQQLPDKEQSYWQVPYDERPVPGASDRWCFFFHYLDVSRPLASDHGPLALPPESPVPDYLRFVRYEEP